MNKHVTDFENDKAALEVHECECGFHIGIDSSYLDQVASVNTPCPSCGKNIHVEKWEI